MVAKIAQAFGAEFYFVRWRSYHQPNGYVRGGVEPDGVWWNSCGLFGFGDGAGVDSKDFFRLHEGMVPDGSGKLTRNAGGAKRSPGLDLAFNADKTVAVLWAIVDEGTRVDVGRAHEDAARTRRQTRRWSLRRATYPQLRRGMPPTANAAAGNSPRPPGEMINYPRIWMITDKAPISVRRGVSILRYRATSIAYRADRRAIHAPSNIPALGDLGPNAESISPRNRGCLRSQPW